MMIATNDHIWYLIDDGNLHLFKTYNELPFFLKKILYFIVLKKFKGILTETESVVSNNFDWFCAHFKI